MGDIDRAVIDTITFFFSFTRLIPQRGEGWQYWLVNWSVCPGVVNGTGIENRE